MEEIYREPIYSRIDLGIIKEKSTDNRSFIVNGDIDTISKRVLPKREGRRGITIINRGGTIIYHSWGTLATFMDPSLTFIQGRLVITDSNVSDEELYLISDVSASYTVIEYF